jgi:hypothetical protein
MTQAETLYTLVSPRGPIIGRALELPDTKVFLRSFTLLRGAGELYLDERATWSVMCDAAIQEFHFLHDGRLFTIPKQRFWFDALPCLKGYSLSSTHFVEREEFYDVLYAPGERTVPALPRILCQATGMNYKRPHVPVPGKYDGRPRMSCLYCGAWIDDETKNQGLVLENKQN